MSNSFRLPILALFGLLTIASQASARGPYIGFVYPAGGQQGTTFEIRLGGQQLIDVTDAMITGQGVQAKLIRCERQVNPQQIQVLRDQIQALRPTPPKKPGGAKPATAAKVNKAAKDKKDAKDDKPAQNAKAGKGNRPANGKWADKQNKLPPQVRDLIARIETRIRSRVGQPACRSLAEIAYVEVTIAPDAKPGRGEIRLVTGRGVTNPMAFQVGQVPETARRPMKTASAPVLGNEAVALRKRPPEEEEVTITLPCTMNGQIASGEVNRYRFNGKKGQRLVITVSARELVPYIADAVPGWFQPVITLYDAAGREVAFSDDYRSKPDPTLYYEVPADGEYVLKINDSIFRGREDFVYRITIGELPFITSIFPLGQQVGKPAKIEMQGWNLDGAKLIAPPKDAKPGICQLVATKDKYVTNPVPFAIDTLPECFDKESNDNSSEAQKVSLPTIVNGRIDQQDDWDVFAVEGKAGKTIVAEVMARRLDSPLDSMLKITDASGKLLAINDDHADPGTGMNTHHADSYIMFKLPADGTYYVHIGDTGRNGGKEYAYRLRISPPRSDFALCVVTTDGGIRSKGGTGMTVYAIRKDGFEGNIVLGLENPPEGFTAWNPVLKTGMDSIRFGMKTTLAETDHPVTLHITGRAKIGQDEVVREAVPAEDRMQAFLWRHLLPSEELCFVVYDPQAKPKQNRVPPKLPDGEDILEKPGKLPPKALATVRQINDLYQESLLTDEFYLKKMKEMTDSLKKLQKDSPPKKKP